MKIISASERLQQQTGVKMVIFGQYGVGKTSLLKTLNAPTLCLDFEAGMLAVQDWNGDSISIRTWDEARDIACLIGGPNPASQTVYSQRHFESIKHKFTSESFSKYQCIFIDSITIASKICLTWSKNQPEAFSNKTGTADLRSAYGLLANEMSAWLRQFQHIPNKDIIFVGLLDTKTDDYGRTIHVPQIEGTKTSIELPGILDEVISMIISKDPDGTMNRKFVCHTLNPSGYPAKDRSGCLDMIEEANLGKLLNKIKNKKLKNKLLTKENQ